MIQLNYILVNFHKSNNLYSFILKEIQNVSSIINIILSRNKLSKYLDIYQYDCREIYSLYVNNSNRTQKRLTVGMNLRKIEYFDRKVSYI